MELSYFFLDKFAKRTSLSKVSTWRLSVQQTFEKTFPNDRSARIDIGQMSSTNLTTGSTVDEIWDASSAIDDIVSHYKGTPHYI